jgi:hypothetical protein
MNRSGAPCSQNPLQPECFSGKMSGSAGCRPGAPNCLASYSAPKGQLLKNLSRSGARANENMSGSVPFSVLKTEDIAVDPDFAVESLNADEACVDCSTVDQATFMQKCVRDSNIGAATLRIAPCSLKANREVQQDNGSRQIDIVASRLNVAYNLTDAANAAPLAAAKASNALFMMHTGAAAPAAAPAVDRVLGNLSPAISIPANAGLVGRL